MKKINIMQLKNAQISRKGRAFYFCGSVISKIELSYPHFSIHGNKGIIMREICFDKNKMKILKDISIIIKNKINIMQLNGYCMTCTCDGSTF